MDRASSSDRRYFARVAEQSRGIRDEAPPESLEAMFDRLERIRRSLGALAQPGVPGEAEGDLASHLALLEHLRTKRSGADRA